MVPMHCSINASRSAEPTRAVFLDRDGTINVEKNYLYRVADWEWIPGAQAAIAQLNAAGYLVVVVSNQAGIARGLYTPDDVERLHAYVADELAVAKARIDAWFYCPHHPQHGAVRECACRKPAPGMLLEAARQLNIDLAASWMVGDKAIDVEAAEAAGVRGILVETGYGARERGQLSDRDLSAADLPAAVQMIIEANKKGC